MRGNYDGEVELSVPAPLSNVGGNSTLEAHSARVYVSSDLPSQGLEKASNRSWQEGKPQVFGKGGRNDARWSQAPDAKALRPAICEGQQISGQRLLDPVRKMVIKGLPKWQLSVSAPCREQDRRCWTGYRRRNVVSTERTRSRFRIMVLSDRSILSLAVWDI